jgi:luciferase family oxidoreductase group 1
MLTHYAALKVAEQFRMLEALYPGRIDMGLGRAPGSDRLTAAALHHGPGALPLEAYPEQIVDLLRYMSGEVPAEHPFFGIRATPVGPSMPEPWLLGSAYDSAHFAAELGLGFAFAQFISPDGGQRIVRDYRERFQPSPLLDEPRVILGVSVICADTDEAAHRIAMSRHLMRLRREQGRPEGGVPSIEEAESTDFSAPERDYLEYQRGRALEGSPQRVREGLLALAAEYEADELMVVTVTHDYRDRMRSYELVGEALGVTPVATP